MGRGTGQALKQDTDHGQVGESRGDRYGLADRLMAAKEVRELCSHSAPLLRGHPGGEALHTAGAQDVFLSDPPAGPCGCQWRCDPRVGQRERGCALQGAFRLSYPKTSMYSHESLSEPLQPDLHT